MGSAQHHNSDQGVLVPLVPGGKSLGPSPAELLILIRKQPTPFPEHPKGTWHCTTASLSAGLTLGSLSPALAFLLYFRMNSLQKQDLRRPKIHGAVRASPYSPPTLASLQRLLWVRRATMLNHINEVWPNLFLGDA